MKRVLRVLYMTGIALWALAVLFMSAFGLLSHLLTPLEAICMVAFIILMLAFVWFRRNYQPPWQRGR